MVTPKGVWLCPTELREVTEASVVTGEARLKAVQAPAKPAAVAPKRRMPRPLLALALVACCCTLFGLVTLHVYAEAFSLPGLGLGVAADAGLAKPGHAKAPGQGYMAPALTDWQSLLIKDFSFDVNAALPEAGWQHLLAESRNPFLTETLLEAAITVEEEIESAVAVAKAEVEAEAEKAPAPAKTNMPVPPIVVPSRALVEKPVLSSRSGDSGEAGEFTIGEETYRFARQLTMEATAYTWTGNKTATGTWPVVGTIAVDPNVIALGSKVYVEGYGFAIAEDTGGLIKGGIIDVYMNTEDECFKWGRKRGITVYILE